MPVSSLGKLVKVGFRRQSAWGTPVATSSSFFAVLADAGSVDVDPDVIVDEDNLTSSSGIYKELERSDVDSTSGMPKISYSFPLEINRLAPHLVAALQNVAEAASTPFQKTMTVNNVPPINFNGNAGYLHTIALEYPSSTDTANRLQDAIVDQLTMTWDFNAKGKARKAQGSVTWVGTRLYYEEILSAPWIVPSPPIYCNVVDNFFFSSLLVNAVSYAAQAARRVEITINNNVTRSEVTSFGRANQWDMAPSITGTIIFQHNPSTEKLLGDFINRLRNALSFNFRSDIGSGTSGFLQFNVPTGRIISNPMIYNNEFVGISVNFEAYYTAGNSLIVVIINDSQDWGY